MSPPILVHTLDVGRKKERNVPLVYQSIDECGRATRLNTTESAAGMTQSICCSSKAYEILFFKQDERFLPLYVVPRIIKLLVCYFYVSKHIASVDYLSVRQNDYF